MSGISAIGSVSSYSAYSAYGTVSSGGAITSAAQDAGKYLKGDPLYT